MDGTMTVELKSLRFFSGHGLYEEEEKAGNEFEVDVWVTFAPQEQPITKLAHTVNYVAVYQIVKGVMEQRQQLLETCAMDICSQLKDAFPQVLEASISIKKLTPPITGFTGSVGVRYAQKF
jgi:dihydroneopterin aldolase